MLLVINFAITYLQLYLQQKAVLHVAATAYSKWKLHLSTIFVMVVHTCVLLLPLRNEFLFLAVYILLLAVSFYMFFYWKFFKCVIMSMGIMLLTTFLEYILQFIITVSGPGIREVLYRYNVIPARLLALFCWLFICIGIEKARPYWDSFRQDIRGSRRTIYILYFVYCLLFTCPNILHFETDSIHSLTPFDVYNLILFISFFVCHILYIHNLHKLVDLEQQMEVQKLYSSTLEKSTESLQGFQHDFSNIICAISGYAELEKWDALQTYIGQINRKFYQINMTNIVHSSLKEYPLLYGVTLSKVSLAGLNGIAFSVSIQSDIGFEYCEQLDLSRMIGILLDNAIEAAKDSTGKEVGMEVACVGGIHTICISNTVNAPVFDPAALRQKGYSTKRGHYGIGLSQLDDIVHSYNQRRFPLSLQSAYDWKTGLFSQTLSEGDWNHHKNAAPGR